MALTFFLKHGKAKHHQHRATFRDRAKPKKARGAPTPCATTPKPDPGGCRRKNRYWDPCRPRRRKGPSEREHRDLLGAAVGLRSIGPRRKPRQSFERCRRKRARDEARARTPWRAQHE